MLRKLRMLRKVRVEKELRKGVAFSASFAYLDMGADCHTYVCVWPL